MLRRVTIKDWKKISNKRYNILSYSAEETLHQFVLNLWERNGKRGGVGERMLGLRQMKMEICSASIFFYAFLDRAVNGDERKSRRGGGRTFIKFLNATIRKFSEFPFTQLNRKTFNGAFSSIYLSLSSEGMMGDYK